MIFFDLEELELNSMNSTELEETKGGYVKEIILLVIGMAMTDWPGFKSGISEGFAAN